MTYRLIGFFFALLISYGVGVYQSSTHAPRGSVSGGNTVTQEVYDGHEDHSLGATVAYIREHHALPPWYLTKKEASRRGWLPSKGNLADVAPHMMIGGDVFTNSQHLLPSARGRVWYEADFDYTHGTRNAKRILYSNDGLVYVTTDHYQTVTDYTTWKQSH